MKVKLILNGYDVGPWIKESGLTQREIVRSERSIVTLDGIKHQAQIRKRGIDVSLIEMRDVRWWALMDAIRTRPVSVEYVDDGMGPRVADFLVSDPRNTAKVVRGGITYFSGGALTLEEV